jgi:hypothetical protein
MRHSQEYVWDTPFEVNGVECRGYVDFAFVRWFGYHQDREGHDMYCGLITSWQWTDGDVWWEFYRASVIIRAYRELLHREPDPPGFACYMNHMRQGWTEAQVRASIMSSQEYRASVMSSDEYRATVIVRAYRELLFREPDEGGYAAYMGAMRNGMTEAQVRASIMSSDEYRQKH